LKEQENKRWLTYYEQNKEAVKARNLARYHQRKGNLVDTPVLTLNNFMPAVDIVDT
jgi:hypothetical protein